MAPPKKKQRVQVVESELSASEGHDNRSSDPVPPVSILKDTVASFPIVKPLLSTDGTEQLNLRRKTYFINGVDTSEENEPCVIHHVQVEASSTVDDKIRRLTYVVTPFPNGHVESPVKCYPGIEMSRSEVAITGVPLQEDSKVTAKPENADDKKENESLISNDPAGGKPRKRGQKKSASSKDARVKTQESENGAEINTVKAKGRRKKAHGHENKTIPTGSQKKPVKRGKGKNED